MVTGTPRMGDSNPRSPEPQSGALTNYAIPTMQLARLEGFEPPAHGLEGRCSIRLSYRRKPQGGFSKGSAGAQRKQVLLSADSH